LDTLFELKGRGDKPDSLFCEWGQGFCCIAGYNESNQSVTQLQYFAFENPANDQTIESIISALGSYGLRDKIIFSFAFPEQLFIPRTLNDSELVKTVYGAHSVFNDHIGAWQVTNQYAIPEKINKAVKKNFISAEFFHAHTVWLKNNTGFDATEQVLVDITPKDFRVLVKRSGTLLLGQVYNYTSPLDVVYYLLKIVAVFNLSKEELVVIVSGLVEENSSLYRELHQYFNNVQFAKPAPVTFDHVHPPHYFTTVLNLASCVS
jgi:hypothetical protein